jgi:hypothetical protein
MTQLLQESGATRLDNYLISTYTFIIVERCLPLQFDVSISWNSSHNSRLRRCTGCIDGGLRGILSAPTMDVVCSNFESIWVASADTCAYNLFNKQLEVAGFTHKINPVAD